MSIAMVGSINTYIKSLKMQQKWTERRQAGDYSGKEKKQTLDEWIREQSKPQPMRGQERTEAESANLQSIQMKVSNGKSLTPEEKEFLKKHDPDTLKKAETIERAREDFKQALRRCRTKEDVERLRMTQLNSSMTIINAVENNPNIPLHKKLEIALLENGKVNAMQEEVHHYVEDGRYEKLPTDAEKLEAEKQELEKHFPKPEQPDASKPTDKTEHTDQTDKTERPEAPEDVPAEDRPEQADEADKPNIKLETPEQKKVKRAKAQAAYGQMHAMAAQPMYLSQPKQELDIKG